MTEPTDLDAAAKIMGRLICCIPEKHRDYSAVTDAVLWLRFHDHPGLWLQASVRDLMEAVVTTEPTDAMHEIANRHSQACMAAIGRQVVKGAVGWQFGMDPQAFIREAIMNALMDALAAKDPP
jgi:hypothetical protein